MKATISIKDVPLVLAEMRMEFARIVRETAKSEDEVVAQRLCEIADAFECGQSVIVDGED